MAIFFQTPLQRVIKDRSYWVLGGDQKHRPTAGPRVKMMFVMAPISSSSDVCGLKWGLCYIFVYISDEPKDYDLAHMKQVMLSL